MSDPGVLTILDVDANGLELTRFELEFGTGSESVRALLSARIVADLERIEPDFPERHVALVQPLRSRERGDEIELFTPPVVDMQAQLAAAEAGFDRQDFNIWLDGKAVLSLDEQIDAGLIDEVRFVRYSLMIGG
ncbi:MAG: hypothetical protein AAF458_22290 [Pseudomonadota bacterium]